MKGLDRPMANLVRDLIAASEGSTPSGQAMKTVTEHIRDHALAVIGVHDHVPRLPDLDELRKLNWSCEFEELMRARLVMGAFRYGLFRDQQADGIRHDSIGSMLRHIEEYQSTGCQEHLIDVANLCLVEFVMRAHPCAHWRSIDDGDHHARRIREAP